MKLTIINLLAFALLLQSCKSEEPQNKQEKPEQNEPAVQIEVERNIVTGTRLPIADKLDEIKEFGTLSELLSNQNTYEYCMKAEGDMEIPLYFLQFLNDCNGISGGKVKAGNFWLVLGRSTSAKSEETYLVAYDSFGEAYDDIMIYGVHAGAGSEGEIKTSLEGDVLVTTNQFTTKDPEANKETSGGDVVRRRFDAMKGLFVGVD